MSHERAIPKAVPITYCISDLYDSVYCEVLMEKCNPPDPRLAAKEKPGTERARGSRTPAAPPGRRAKNPLADNKSGFVEPSRLYRREV